MFRRLLIIGLLASFAQALFAHEGLHEQISALNARIAKEPRNAQLYVRRAELHRQHREWTHAFADLDRAAKADPSLAVIDLARAMTALDSGDARAARSHVTRFLATHPEHLEARLTLARALVSLGETAEALREYDRAIAAAEEPAPDLYYERAMLTARSDPSAALRGIDEGLARLGFVDSLQLTAIDIASTAGDFAEAQRRIDTVIEHAPRKERYLMQKGDLLQRAGKPDEARVAYDAALAAIASLPEPHRSGAAMKRLTDAVTTARARL